LLLYSLFGISRRLRGLPLTTSFDNKLVDTAGGQPEHLGHPSITEARISHRQEGLPGLLLVLELVLLGLVPLLKGPLNGRELVVLRVESPSSGLCTTT
jgi:hypothetical protein